MSSCSSNAAMETCASLVNAITYNTVPPQLTHQSYAACILFIFCTFVWQTCCAGFCSHLD